MTTYHSIQTALLLVSSFSIKLETERKIGAHRKWIFSYADGQDNAETELYIEPVDLF